MVPYFQERVEEFSPRYAAPILGNTCYHYQSIAKALNDAIELWYTPVEWYTANTLPVAYQAVPNEWITYPGVEVFIVPVLASDAGIEIAHRNFGKTLVGDRIPSPDNPGGYITVVTRKDEEYQVIQRSLALWEGPRQMQEPFNRRIYELSSRAEPANAEFAEFLGQFSKEETVVIAHGLAPAEPGCFRPWAAVFVQEGRRMEHTGKDVPETPDQQVALSAILVALT